jgi:hypothetical protein
VTVICCAVAWPAWWTVAAALIVLVGSVVLVRSPAKRELLMPQHLREIDRVCEEVFTDPGHARRETSFGVGISSHALPDGRIDWIMSSTTHPHWSAAMARRIADALWRENEVIEGHPAGVVHIVVARDS